MKTYHICYLMSCYGSERELDVLANNKAEAYDKAVYEEIPRAEDGHYPYGAYVESVTYSNGNHKTFNTIIGNPY